MFSAKKNLSFYPYLFTVALAAVLQLSNDLLFAQTYEGEGGNKKPKIRGQRDLDTNEEQSITLSLLDLHVDDDDDLYPFGFTLKVFAGNNYTVSDRTVTPVKDFYGKLKVPVRVNDGENDSEEFDLEITVNNINDTPVITGQQSINANSGIPFNVQPGNLTVTDPDDDYPQDFTLRVSTGENYSVAGSQVTPASNFEGMLTIPVRVNDGSVDSETFGLKVQVTKLNSKPLITSQTPVIINEDESFTINTANIRVNDPGYPSGYTLAINPGDNYSVNGSTIMPKSNFNGNLFVSLKVATADKTSDPYNFLITVRPVNDPPVLNLTDSTAVRVEFGSGPINPFGSVQITDVDDDSLTIAEINIDPESYQIGVDELRFVSTPSIRGVFDDQSGILALIGKASIADYVDAIQSVEYELVNATAGRNLTVAYATAGDGRSTSKPEAKVIAFSDLVAGSFDIPSGFTPNGDFVNDTWSIRPLEPTQTFDDAVIRIYTKSGLMVYEGFGFTSEWDGKYNGTLLPPDVYFYTLQIGVSPSQSLVKGIVTLLR